MKVVVTGRPYGVGGKGDAVVAEVADAVVAEVADAEVEEAAGPAGRPGRPMPMRMSSFQCTRLVGLLVYRIGPSSLHSCDGGIVQIIPKTITLRRQN